MPWDRIRDRGLRFLLTASQARPSSSSCAGCWRSRADQGYALDQSVAELHRKFSHVPPFVADMQPQGFLGAAFSRQHPDLDLPERLRDWIACDEDQCLGMLVKRSNETLDDLMRRLDAAIEQAHEDGDFIDEINARSRP